MHAIGVRADWAAQARRMAANRRRIGWGLAATLAAMWLAIFVAERLPVRLAFRSALADAGTWGLACGAATWYALRYRTERWRESLWTTLLAGLGFIIADVVVKWNLATWVPVEMQRSPLLYWGVWQLMLPLAVLRLQRRYPQEMRAMGLGFKSLGRNMLAGLVGGAALAGHFLFSVSFTGAGQMRWPPFPNFFWQLCFELAAPLGAEFFFRGVLYRYLEDRRWAVWWAALLSAVCNVSLYMLKARWTGNVVTTVGVIFYVLMLSLLNALLYRWTRSLWPGYFSALTFNLTVMGYR